MHPLVLLHAFPFSSAMWYPQRAGLEPLGVRILGHDQRGFANGAADPSSYSLDDVADDVARFLDAEKLDRVVLGGLSMGGYVALRFLARHPGRLAGPILSDTKATPDTEEGKKNRAALAAKVRAEGAGAAIQATMAKLLAPRTIAERPEIAGFVRGLGETRGREAVARGLEAMAARPDSTADLARAKVPVLIIVGAEDSLTVPSDAEAMARAHPAARLRKLPGAGHLANLEDPLGWNRAVLSFLLDVAI
ncbi:MAG: alpha/beta fold hydrolase [Planctomycetota bacterium]